MKAAMNRTKRRKNYIKEKGNAPTLSLGGQQQDRPPPTDREILDATWKLLDQDERDFAATFYLQCWWRRFRYQKQPKKMAQFRTQTRSLSAATKACVKAQYSPDELTGKHVYVLEKKTQEEIDTEQALAFGRWPDLAKILKLKRAEKEAMDAALQPPPEPDDSSVIEL